jgi:Ca2+-binding EF-hand superfamily protein
MHHTTIINQVIVALLTMSVEDLRVVFTMLDRDGSGTIDQEEFTAVLAALLSPGAGPSSSSSKTSAESNGGRSSGEASLMLSVSPAAVGAASRTPYRPAILTHLFGKDGKGHLSIEAFAAFLRGLHAELRELEFR